MSKEFTNLFALIGVLFSSITFGFILIIICDFIKTKIDKLKFYHKIKHRFDKPPIADCYCIDCKFRNRENQKCFILECCVEENQFCWHAEPVDVETANKQKTK